MSLATHILPAFDEEFAITRKFLALVPDDHLLWKPHDKSMELGRLAWHVADFPEWCLITFTQPKLVLTPESTAEMMNWQGKTRVRMLARFDADLAKARAALAATSDAEMAKRWTMEWNGQTIVDDTREAVYRKWTMHHMVHHRAQLGVYLRLLGIAIPGCYGPSADEMPPVEATAD